MENLARATIRGRWFFVGLWILLTIAGAMATGKLADRWFEQFSIPGYSAYEANQRTLAEFGTGRQYPLVAVFTVANGDIREQAGIENCSNQRSASLPVAITPATVSRTQRPTKSQRPRIVARARVSIQPDSSRPDRTAVAAQPAIVAARVLRCSASAQRLPTL